jgi:hypothetical protein
MLFMACKGSRIVRTNNNFLLFPLFFCVCVTVCVCAENFSNYYLCDSGNCGDAESHDGLAVFTVLT